MGEWGDDEWGDLATLEYGKALRGYENALGPYRVYGTNGPIGWHRESLANHATVIVGRKGAYRGIHYSPAPCWVIDTAFYLKPKIDFDMRWAYYELLTHDINNMDSGSAIPSTSREAFYRMPVRVPPKDEQRAIAHILGTLDDKIELNRRVNETLEAIARALFKSWFVDFDPVHAKAEGRDPGLPKDVSDVFPDSFQDAALGEIPMGWKVGTLADYAELNPESWSKDNPPHTIQYVDLANTKWGKVETTQRHLWEDAPSRAQRVLRPGDSIVGTVRPGNGSFAFISEVDLTASTGFAVLRPRMPVYRELVYLAATSHENIERLSHLADGGAYPAVRPEVVISTKIVRASDAVAQRFAMSTGPLMSRMAANDRESRTLAALRDLLLPKLISGVLRVKDPRRIFGDAPDGRV